MDMKDGMGMLCMQVLLTSIRLGHAKKCGST